ncbi:O-antigen ligase family protein [Oxynema sp. CENA135]|uniref:O-antigen ligase family protein n=1 Tax=Oxynema sp. CENA135 TaxID=984206 RepID=UPI00190DD910|nr:O-antigen ligase [Oxynema sp. CENA135]MBK4730579.1 O-antigen ligase family protein [Oxynema sp. CENA135]
MNVFSILSDLLKLEKVYAIFGIIVFTGILTLSSRYVPSEGVGGGGTSPFERPVVLLQYATIGISLILLALRPKSAFRVVWRDPFLWGLVLMTPISFVWSDFPSFSLKRGISTLQTTMFGVYLASRYDRKELLDIVTWALGITAVFSFLYTLALPGSGIEKGIHSGAWRGPLVHKNVLAQLTALISLPTCLAAIHSPPKYRKRLWAVFIITVLLVLLTRSKTGLMVFLTLMMLVPLFKILQSRGGIAIPVIIFAIFVVSSGTTILAENWEPFLYGLGKDPSLSGRTYLWQASIDMIRLRPWFGYGYQAFWQGTGAANQVWLAIRYVAPHSHNGFINISLDLGLVGLFFFVMSLLTMFVRGIALLRIEKSPAEMWPLLYASFLLLYNQTESTIIQHNNLFWILHVAVSLSLGYVRKLSPSEVREYRDKQAYFAAMNETPSSPSPSLNSAKLSE